MIDPATRYGARVDTTTDPIGYPDGQAQNETAPATNDGTPCDENWVNDIWGFFYAVLDFAGDSANNVVEKVGATQILDALKAKFALLTDARFPTQPENDACAGTSGAPSSLNKFVTNSDTRLVTAAQAAGIAASPNAITGLNAAASQADIATALSGRLLAQTVIQGSVDDELATTPGYIDTTDIAENNVTHNGNISYSINGAVLATSVNWSSIFPISKPANVVNTEISITQFIAGVGAAAEEDSATGSIFIDWVNLRVYGWIMGSFGGGYTFQACYRFSGSIGAGANDFAGLLQNGSYASGGSAPTFRVDGTLEEIQRLPMIGKCRNVGFTIKHFS